MNSVCESEIYRVRPKDFSPFVEVAACYIQSDGRYLHLHRAKGMPQELTWCVPAGKMEVGESPRQGVIRETLEETGLRLDGECLMEVGTLYIRNSNLDFVFHMFTRDFPEQPEVVLSDEHSGYRWVEFDEALDLPYISGGKEIFHQFLAMVSQPPLPRKGFYFVRHGETDVNANPNIKRVDYDLPLNEKGKQQAVVARDIANKLPIKTIRFSPIQRAKETKAIIADTIEADHLEDEQLSECKADVWTKMVALEGGENSEVCSSVCEFLSRVSQGLIATLEDSGPTLVVAHGGVHWAICYHMRIENHPWKIGNCEVVHFEPAEENRWKATILNSVVDAVECTSTCRG